MLVDTSGSNEGLVAPGDRRLDLIHYGAPLPSSVPGMAGSLGHTCQIQVKSLGHLPKLGGFSGPFYKMRMPPTSCLSTGFHEPQIKADAGMEGRARPGLTGLCADGHPSLPWTPL